MRGRRILCGVGSFFSKFIGFYVGLEECKWV